MAPRRILYQWLVAFGVDGRVPPPMDRSPSCGRRDAPSHLGIKRLNLPTRRYYYRSSRADAAEIQWTQPTCNSMWAWPRAATVVPSFHAPSTTVTTGIRGSPISFRNIWLANTSIAAAPRR